MANRFTILNTRPFQSAKIFTFTSTSGIEYNLSLSYVSMDMEKQLPYLDVSRIGGITKLLSDLNRGIRDPKTLNWIEGKFYSYRDGLPVGIVRISPVSSQDSTEIIMDNSVLPESAPAAASAESAIPAAESAIPAAESAIPAAAQPGGSLYDKNGKLLYRGQMKNGVPHGYGTGYYANGKVGHVGMFKGGKIVQ